MSTAYVGKIGKEDLKLWDGKSDLTFNRRSSTGGYLELHTLDWVGVDVLQAHGAGKTSTDEQLSAAIASVGSATRALWLAPVTWTIAANVTVPANVYLSFAPGAVLAISSGYTLTISGAPENVLASPRQQIFSGAGTVVFTKKGTGYPGWWGATGDGTTDDTTEVQSAFTALAGGRCHFPAGTYLISTKLTTVANTLLTGDGKQVSIIKKGANIDMIDLAAYCGMRDLKLDGDSGSYTGRGVLITADYSQFIDNCQITTMNSYCVEYSQDAGNLSYIINSEIYRGANVISIKLPSAQDSAACTRKIINCSGGGSTLIDFAAGVDTWFIGNFTNGLIFSTANSYYAFIIGNRIGTAGANITIDGNGHHIVGNAFADDVILAATAADCIFDDNVVPDWDVTDSSSGSSVYQKAVAFTPVWSQADDPQPAIGNGTLTGRYSRNGARIDITILWEAGATTTFGNNTSSYKFSVPLAPTAGIAKQLGIAFIQDATDSSITTHKVEAPAGFAYVTLATAAGGTVRSDAPITFDVGDKIELQISYLVG